MNTFKAKTINITRVSNPSSKEKSREKIYMKDSTQKAIIMKDIIIKIYLLN